MYSKLILNNWKAQPGKISLVFIALVLGITLMTLLAGLDNGLKSYFLDQGRQEKILRELTVTPAGTKFELNLANLIPKPQLDPAIIDKIRAIPEVEDVLPTNTVSGISSLEISLLGQTFQTDSLLYGAPYPLLDSPRVTTQDWQNIDEPFPAVISSKLIDLYNFSFANANNLPQITEQNFIGKEITILLNKSTFFATESAPVVTLRAKIVGFSPNTKIIGLTLPLEVINRINKNYLHQNQQNYLDAVVHVRKPEYLSLVQNKLQNLGLTVTTSEQSLKTLEGLFQVTDLSLTCFFLIMMIMAGLLISSTFLNKIAERGREIAILKTLGFTGNQVGLLYLSEAALLGLISSLVGLTIGLLLSWPLELILSTSLKTLLNKPDHFFVYSFQLISSIIIFSIFISCLFAYLPARKAAKLDPVKLLAK